MLPMFGEKLLHCLLLEKFHHCWSISRIISINIFCRTNIRLLSLLSKNLWLLCLQFVLKSRNYSFIIRTLKVMISFSLFIYWAIVFYPWIFMRNSRLILTIQHFINLQTHKLIPLYIMLHLWFLILFFLIHLPFECLIN